MKVILLKDISKLGQRYDVKNVSDGYALNMLIPRGLAIAATESAMKHMETEKSKTEGEKKVRQELLLKNLKELDGKTITVSGKANDKGYLFAGLHKEDIVAELKKQTRLEIDPASVQLEHPIKELGEHSLEVKGEGKSVRFQLKVEKV